MARSALAEVLATVPTLSADELRQVEHAVKEELRQHDEAAAEEAFLRALVDAGLMREVKPPPPRADRDRPLVPIQGKPLSETIIEERR